MADHIPFKVHAPYEPAGDQPAAIDRLVKGIEAGLAAQTILGVTGSGKSVVGSTKVLLSDNGRCYHVRIDSLAPKFPHLPEDPSALQFLPLSGTLTTPALDPETGDVAMGAVSEISRHRYQGRLYAVSTSDGRNNTFTDSHNLFVMRKGHLALVKSEDLKVGDHLPVPHILPHPTNAPLFQLDITEWICNDGAYVSLLGGCDLPSNILPPGKAYRVRKGERVSLAQYKAMNAVFPVEGTFIGSDSRKATLPITLPVSQELLRFIGLFVAEGCVLRRGVALSSGDESIIDEIYAAAKQLGLEVRKSKNRDYDYIINGTTISKLMQSWCGAGAKNKHLPAFWPQLDNKQLGVLLSGIFAGDGCPEKGAITLSSVSCELVSDVQLALSRFGIAARIRPKRTIYRGEKRSSWNLSISGGANCIAFREHVGFGLERKDGRLDVLCDRTDENNTNVDTMPLPVEAIAAAMQNYGVTQKQVAKHLGVNRSLVSMYLHEKRRPERIKAKKMALLLAAIAEQHNDHALSKQLQIYAGLADVAWSPVKTIEVHEHDTVVYDLSVPGVQTFLANGYFVHNTFTVAHLIERTQLPTIIMAPNKTLAAQLYGEFKSFFPDNAVEYFVSYYDYYQPEAYIPSSDTFIDKDAQINEQIEQMRLSATKSLLERKDVIVVASVSAIYGLGDPTEFFKMVLHMKRGDKLEQRYLLARLAELQYARNDVELKRATFRVRGETIDVFPADHDRNAVRISLFDGEIESLHLLDPLTGQVGKPLNSYTLFPKSHYVTTRQRTLDAIETIRAELDERLKELRAQNKLVEEQRLEQRTRFDLEMMAEVGYCNGIENYSRHLTGQRPGQPPPTLFSYLPPEALLVVDESHVTVPQVGGMFKADRSRKQTLVDFGFRLPSALDNRPLSFEEWEARIPRTVFVSATPGKYELEHTDPADIVELVVRPTGLIDPEVEIRPVATQVDDLLSEINLRVAMGDRVLVTTLTKKMSENLTEYLFEHGIKVRYLHSDVDTLERTEILRDLRLGVFDVLIGINLLREGLDLPEVSLVAILDADKEGFLRSTNSLIQTIGRAARNVRGKAILYADRITASMKQAIDETARRRAKQVAHNEAHGITPTTINRRVADIMEGLRDTGDKKGNGKSKTTKPLDKLEDQILDFPPERAGRELAKLEKQMLELAKNLEFEKAAQLRDQVLRLREKLLINPSA